MHFMSNQKITNVNDTHNLNMYYENNKNRLYYIRIGVHDTLANNESVIPIYWSHSALNYLKSLKSIYQVRIFIKIWLQMSHIWF